MRWLLTASLMAGLVIQASAQRSAPAGHAGGSSAPHGFATPHMSGGFSSGSHFSSAPVMGRSNFSTPPQYHWSMPARSTGSRPLYSSNGNRYSPPSGDKHKGRPPYPASQYRQPYVPYLYARSTYLVPGLLNSYWDNPDSSYSGDQASTNTAQGQVENNGDYAPESAPYEPQQQAED